MQIMQIAIGLFCGIVFFISTISAYCIGVKHGRCVKDDIQPVIELNPVKVIKESVDKKKAEKEEKEQSDLILEGLYNIHSYTGDPQGKEGD